MTRIGILGAGSTVAIADRHARAFARLPGCRVSAVCSRSLQSCRRLAAAAGLQQALLTTDPAAFFEQADAVVICTPDSTHLAYACRAAALGKPVLLEKPLGLRFAAPGQLEQLLAAPAPVMVGYVYRYAQGVQWLRRLVAESLGPVWLFDAMQGGHRLADPTLPVEWRMQKAQAAGGALADFGSHLLDLARFTAGIELQQAAGWGEVFIPSRPAGADGAARVDNSDAFVFCGRGRQGQLCSFTTSRVGLDGVHLQVSGQGGLARLHLEAGQGWYWPKAPQGAYLPARQAQTVAFADGPQQWFDRQAADFARLAQGQAVDCCTLRAAAQSERLLEELAAAGAAR